MSTGAAFVVAGAASSGAGDEGAALAGVFRVAPVAVSFVVAFVEPFAALFMVAFAAPLTTPFAGGAASLMSFDAALGTLSGPRHSNSICVPFGSVCTSRTGSQPSEGASHTSMRRRSPSWRGSRMKWRAVTKPWSVLTVSSPMV
ncbi:MAG: hypothetical protein LBV73_25700, partial [Paraburkholderia sp.]|nr:hypothetical protein [Paraburkholderia sp.]